MTSLGALASITVEVKPEAGITDFQVQSIKVEDLLKPRMSRPEPSTSNYSLKDGKFVIPASNNGFTQYKIPTAEGEYALVYASPDEELTVNITGISPLTYTVSGSPLMEDISKLDTQASAIMDEYQQLVGSGKATPQEVEAIETRLYQIFKDYINSNPDAEGVAYAMLNLESKDFMEAYNNLTPQARKSRLMVLVEPRKQLVEERMAAEQRLKEFQTGKIEAPNFTFNNADGKPVSLSDFRGKWVIIDFWGTWCPWCIKGFPALKKAYAEYSPRLEVIGVACNDKYDAWLNGLKKYELPWINVYNPEEGGGKILQDYAVEGFPTKVIVNPEGKIVNITAGENPEFFNILKGFIK